MTDNSKKALSSEKLEAEVDIVTGADAQTALIPEVLRSLVHNLVETTFDKPKITPKMGRDEVRDTLDRYGYSRSILQQESLSGTRIGSMAQGFIDRFRHACSLPVYDMNALQEEIASAQIHREEVICEQVKDINDAEMIVAKEDGEVVGMLGIRRLGVIGGRRTYEHVKASVLPNHRKSGIFRKLKTKALEFMFSECSNPLLLVHTKTPTVRAWAVGHKHRVITCEEYVSRHPKWKMSPDQLEALEKTWKEHGWEYFEVDLSSEDFSGQA